MRNKYEQALADQLGPEWQYEVVKIPYVIEHQYIPDFVDPKTKTIKEGKGHWDAADRRKIKAVAQQNPDWTIIMVFQNPNLTISKKSKTTYWEWCERHGIAWEQGPNVGKKKVPKPN